MSCRPGNEGRREVRQGPRGGEGGMKPAQTVAGWDACCRDG